MGSLPGFRLLSASKVVVHCAHVALHDWVLPLGKNIIRTLFHGVPESVGGRFFNTALVIAERGIETTWICEPAY